MQCRCSEYLLTEFGMGQVRKKGPMSEIDTLLNNE